MACWCPHDPAYNVSDFWGETGSWMDETVQFLHYDICLLLIRETMLAEPMRVEV